MYLFVSRLQATLTTIQTWNLAHILPMTLSKNGFFVFSIKSPWRPLASKNCRVRWIFRISPRFPCFSIFRKFYKLVCSYITSSLLEPDPPPPCKQSQRTLPLTLHEEKGAVGLYWGLSARGKVALIILFNDSPCFPESTTPKKKFEINIWYPKMAKNDGTFSLRIQRAPKNFSRSLMFIWYLLSHI